MKCISPYRKKNPDYPEKSDIKYFDCPCGKCHACLSNRRQQWLIRLEQEQMDSSLTLFVTLTYNDDNCDGYLHKEHLQKFFKRLRKYMRFKYYAIGEFGTTTFRPHYHAIIFVKFSLSEETSIPTTDECEELVNKCWPHGHTLTKTAHPAGMNYVLHYHVRPKFPFGDKVRDKKTFCVMSQGLGLSLIRDAMGEFDNNIVYTLQTSPIRKVCDRYGRTFVIPRYFTKKLEEAGINIYRRHKKQTLYDILTDNYTKDYISRATEQFKMEYPDAEFYSDGSPKNYPPRFFNDFVIHWKQIDKQKLNKYNYQSPNAL